MFNTKSDSGAYFEFYLSLTMMQLIFLKNENNWNVKDKTHWHGLEIITEKC
jgi:hypothetical protein